MNSIGVIEPKLASGHGNCEYLSYPTPSHIRTSIKNCINHYVLGNASRVVVTSKCHCASTSNVAVTGSSDIELPSITIFDLRSTCKYYLHNEDSTSQYEPDDYGNSNVMRRLTIELDGIGGPSDSGIRYITIIMNGISEKSFS